MRKIRFEQWVLLFVVVVVAVSTSVIGIATLNQSREGATAHDALCVLKADLKQRVQASEAFLAEHPNGIPGIPAATIQTSITSQRRTIDALAGLQCPEGK